MTRHLLEQEEPALYSIEEAADAFISAAEPLSVCAI